MRREVFKVQMCSNEKKFSKNLFVDSRLTDYFFFIFVYYNDNTELDSFVSFLISWGKIRRGHLWKIIFLDILIYSNNDSVFSVRVDLF